MRIKTLICDIADQIMDIELEMRISNYVRLYQRGDFDDDRPGSLATLHDPLNKPR